MTIAEIETSRVRLDLDADRWPDVARLPQRPLRAAIARRLFERAIAGLPMTVEVVPTGERWGAGRPGDPVLRLVRPDAVFDRLGDSGLIGLGEAYMADEWDATDVVAVFGVLADHVAELLPPWLQRLRRLGVRRQPTTERNSRAGARRNISRHYDLSNELFASFLDPTMSYSSALFASGIDLDGGARHDDLDSAQHRKIDRMLDACAVGEGSRVLEIGTGWGELALRAAARGAQVTTITLSVEQQQLARERIATAGLADRVSVELCDYRDVDGSFDAVVSVEMIEAVGEAYWPTYFATLERVLAPGGRVAVQAITLPHDRLLATRRDYTWIHKYVFPGGLIPSVEAVGAQAHIAGLEVTDDFAFGVHYAETLRLWRESFAVNGHAVADFGTDPTFARMWTFYLAYCEAGFRSGYLDVHQFVMERP